MLKAIYAGTFDPLTNGHLDIITRASKLVDELVVLVASNQLKKHTFSTEERVEMIQNVITDLKNVRVDVTDGLVVRYAEENNIQIMFRGLRNIQDYEYEYSLSKYNTNLNNKVETVLLFPSSNTDFVSSSAIKELVFHSADISPYVPKANLETVINKFKK